MPGWERLTVVVDIWSDNRMKLHIFVAVKYKELLPVMVPVPGWEDM
jgi:hypothetical protein